MRQWLIYASVAIISSRFLMALLILGCGCREIGHHSLGICQNSVGIRTVLPVFLNACVAIQCHRVQQSRYSNRAVMLRFQA